MGDVWSHRGSSKSWPDQSEQSGSLWKNPALLCGEVKGTAHQRNHEKVLGTDERTVELFGFVSGGNQALLFTWPVTSLQRSMVVVALCCGDVYWQQELVRVKRKISFMITCSRELWTWDWGEGSNGTMTLTLSQGDVKNESTLEEMTKCGTREARCTESL